VTLKNRAWARPLLAAGAAAAALTAMTPGAAQAAQPTGQSPSDPTAKPPSAPAAQPRSVQAAKPQSYNDEGTRASTICLDQNYDITEEKREDL
jgi:hypothetical protein